MILLLIAFGNFETSAQYKDKTILINVGLGLNNYYGKGMPLAISVEKYSYNSENLTLGMEFAYVKNEIGTSLWGYQSIYGGGRLALHISEYLNLDNDVVDIYTGGGVGYRYFKWDDNSYGYGYEKFKSQIAINAFIGGRIAISPSLGLAAELGYIGLSNAKVGVSFRF